MFHVEHLKLKNVLKSVENIGLYIHIPFCKSKCGYCDFFRVTDLNLIDKYVDSLINELTILSVENKKFRTIYIGGGTPSVLPIDVFQKLLKTINKLFLVEMTKEFTVECNPEDVTETLIKLLYDNGVNRISMGVQSFDDNMLKFMNRRHNAQKVYQSIDIVQNIGISNISIDMIFGLPIIDEYSFDTDVEKFVNIGVEHLSAYSLSYEANSYFSCLLKNKKLHTPSDDDVAQQYERLTQKLSEKGYLHYEISNYCKPKNNNASLPICNFEQLNKYYFNSKHNTACWQRAPYYGVGAGAYSFDGIRRWNNIANIEEYIQNSDIENIREYEYLTSKDVYNETVMLGLRTLFGVNENMIDEKYRDYFAQKAKQLFDENKLYILSDNSFAIPESEWFLLDLITEKMML